MLSSRTLFLLLPILCLTTASAQTNQASISGVVTDAQNAAVAGATVTVANIETRVPHSAVTNAAGFYSISNIPVGDYRLTVEHAGFRRYEREGVSLSTAQSAAIDIKLEVGGVSETISVSAATPLIESRTSDIGQLIESKSIEDLPLGNRRTMNIINLTGASVFVTYPNVPGNSSPSFSLAGGRTTSQMFWIDGGTGQNIRLGQAQINLDPPVETVEEIKVLSNNYSAEYGGASGGVILETTKSGGNRLHGSAYDYLRNDLMDAPGFFAPVQNGTKQEPELRYNIFGATVSGPIRQNKTFFFFAYEGERLRTGGIDTVTTPTAAQRSGDFSQTFNTAGKVIPIYDPSTTQTAGGVTTRTQFPNNIIPTNRLDPVALNVMKFYPLPNHLPSNISGANNFIANFVQASGSDFLMAKVDHNLTAKDRITGRYLWTAGTNPFSSPYPDPAADPKTHTVNAQHFAYADWTRTISPATVNDARFTYVYRKSHLLTNGVGGNYPEKLGLQGVDNNAFPQFAPAGFSSLGSATQERLQTPIDQYQWVDDLTHVSGRHAMKFGIEARRSRDHETNQSTASGAFTFATQPTGLPGNATTGNGMASLLLGFPTAFAEATTSTLNRTSWYLVGFAQDQWTLSSALTLNLGIRWESDTPIKDSANRINGFDPYQINPVSGTPGVVKFLGVNGYRTNAFNGDWNNFSPRVGFAWKPFRNGRTVVRGGFGLFYTLPVDSAQPNAAALGFGFSAALNSPDNGITAPFLLRNGVPTVPNATPVLNDSFGAVPFGQNPTTAVTYFDVNRRTGYSEQFNFGVQHELAGQMMVEATMLGNLSRKLPNANLSVDQIPSSILGPAHNSQKDRPYAQFSDVMIVAPTWGVSNYYAAMVRFQKRYAHGLNIGGSFTFSKFLGNINDPGAELGNNGGPYSNFYNRRADYGPEPDDVTRRFVFNAVYELPFGSKHHMLATGPLSRIFSGWSIANVSTLQSGPPITITTQTNTTNSFSAGALRPNVLQDPNLPSGQRSVAAWFNTAVFAQPALYQFGNEGVGIVRAPGLVNLDFSIIREFHIAERFRLQFRGEAFNALNHTNLSLPGRTFGGAGFGVITASGPARQIEVGTRLTF